MEDDASMRGDGIAPSDGRLHGTQLYVHNLDGRSPNNTRWQIRLCEDHIHADVNKQDARELRGRADVRLAAHVAEVLSAHPDSWDVDGWDVKEDSASRLGVEPSVGVHGVRGNASLVGTLVPMPRVSQARICVA